MTDKELIEAFRECERHEICFDCPLNEGNCPIDEASTADMMKRLEALLAENERLKAQLPKWVSAEERLPESNDKCVLTVVNGVYDEIHFYDAIEIAEFVLDEGWILESYPDWENPNVTYWCKLPEPPSTEGVE